jgi:regulatory protein
MAEITALRTHARRRSRIEIDLDGRPWLTAPATAVAGLGVGSILDAEAQADLRHRAEAAEALESAGRLLARRRHTEQELRRRWQGKGFSAAAIERALAQLKRNGAVDDAAFARDWVENRMSFRPRSAAMLRAELRSKGVGPVETAAALAELNEESAARLAAERAARRWRSLEAEGRRRKVYAYLVRRGFTQDTIRSVLGRRATTAGRSEE